MLDNAKVFSNFYTMALISHASEVMNKIFQARLQQYMNREFVVVQLDLEKAEEPEIIHPRGKGMQKSNMAVWEGLANSCEKERSEKQRRKGKI